MYNIRLVFSKYDLFVSKNFGTTEKLTVGTISLVLCLNIFYTRIETRLMCEIIAVLVGRPY